MVSTSLWSSSLWDARAGSQGTFLGTELHGEQRVAGHKEAVGTFVSQIWHRPVSIQDAKESRVCQPGLQSRETPFPKQKHALGIISEPLKW